MADAVQVQKELDTLQKFALLLEIDQDTEYLAVVETQLTQVYGSRLAEAIGRDKYDQLMANPDQLDRVLGLLEQIRQVLIADEHADWRGALEENVRLLEEKRKQEIETKIAEEKTVSLADARTKLVKTLTPLLPYADPDIIELAADMVVLNCADRPEEALVEAVRTIDIISSTTGVDIAIDPLAIANALEPAAPVLEITYPEFQEVAAQIAAEFAVQSPVDTSSAAFVYTTNLITTAAYAGLPNTVIDISKNTQKIESLALQFLKIPQAAQVTQILSQPQLQLPKLFQSIKQEISAQSQFNKAVDKHVKLSGASKEEQKIAAEVIKRYVMPPVSVIYSLAETPEEKQSLAKSAFQKFATQIGLDQYSRGARVRMASISQAVYFQVQSFPYADFQSLMLHRRTLKSGSPASPYMEMFFGQMQNMITDKVAKEVINKAATSLGIKLGTQAAVTAGAEVAVEAGVVAAGAATGPPGWVVAAAAIVVGFAKDIISKSSRWVRENWPVLVGALAGLVGGIFAGFAPVGIAVAGFVGGVGGTALTQGGVSRIGSGASRFFNGIAGLAVVEIATPILVIALTVPIVVALILFIINNSAYIVPQAVGTISGGISPAGCNLQCLQFSGFSASEQAQIESAACTILNNSCIANGLCSTGQPIVIKRVNQNLGYCGEQTNTREISIYDGGVDGSKCSGLYTLGHELGHVFSSLNLYYQTNYSTIVLPRRSSCLPTYELYYQKDPVMCKKEIRKEFPDGHIETEIVSGSGEDAAEIMAQYFVNPGLLASYSPQNELAQKTFASPSCSQSSSSTAYVIEGNLSDIVISRPSDINSPSPTCSWSAKNTPNGGAVNANYFFIEEGKKVPVGWAGDPTVSSYKCGNSCASMYFDGSSIQFMSDSDRPTGGTKPARAVSGLSLDAASTQQTNRTAIGIKGNTIYLVVVPNATTSQLKGIMSQLGVSQSMQLDGGSSSTICQGGSLKYGSNTTVPVSIGLTSGTLKTYDLP